MFLENFKLLKYEKVTVKQKWFLCAFIGLTVQKNTVLHQITVNTFSIQLYAETGRQALIFSFSVATVCANVVETSNSQFESTHLNVLL